MSTAQQLIAAAITIAVIAIIGLVATRLFLRPDDMPTVPRYQPRHRGSQHSGAERIPTAGELAAWREDWTDTELAALRGETPLPLPPEPGWSLHRWQAEQESWLEARRREAHEQQLLLRARVWADPWWIR